MNIFSKDFWFKDSVPEVAPDLDVIFSQKSSQPIDLSEKADRSSDVNYQGIGRTKYASGLPPTENYKAPLNAFNSYPVVRGVVTAIADAISSLDIKVYKVKGGEKVEDTKHDFHNVFRTPNPYEGSQEFLEKICINLDLFGNCFIAIEKGSPLELYVLQTPNVAIIPDAKIKVKEYRYYINGNQTPYKPEEIIHIRYSDPEDPYFGASPLKAATKVLSLENNRLTYANAFFSNGAVPLGVLQTENTVSETILNKLRSEWTRLHQGTNNAYKTAILQGGLKYVPIASGLKDLDVKALKELSTSDILNLYRTPAIVLGDLTEAGGEEGKAALTAWWRGALVPRIKRIETAINKGLRDVVFGGGKAYFTFDLTSVPALADDKVQVAKYIETLMGCSVLKPNEARSIIGQPKESDPNADKLLISNSFFGNALLPLESVGEQGAGSNAPKPAATPSGNPAAKPKKEIDYVMYDSVNKLKELTKYLREME